MDPIEQYQRRLTRRAFLGSTSVGVGSAALSWLLGPQAAFAALQAEQRQGGGVLKGFPHFAPKAKRVIFLYMSGGPSHLETFDHRPKLAEMDGQAMPGSVTRG